MSILISIIVVGVLVGLDQWSKVLTVEHLKNKADMSLIDGVFELSYVENRGASFGMLQNMRWLFVVFTIIVLIGMIIIFIRLPRTKHYNPLKACMAVLFAGAVGNLIDRIRFGFVVDMFHFYWFEFPVFNVADICVVISCAMLIILMLFYYKDEDLDFVTLIGGKKNESTEDLSDNSK